MGIYQCASTQMDYNNVALGLTAGVVGLRAFSRDRLVFYREASSGLNRCAPPPTPRLPAAPEERSTIAAAPLHLFARPLSCKRAIGNHLKSLLRANTSCSANSMYVHPSSDVAPSLQHQQLLHDMKLGNCLDTDFVACVRNRMRHCS